MNLVYKRDRFFGNLKDGKIKDKMDRKFGTKLICVDFNSEN